MLDGLHTFVLAINCFGGGLGRGAELLRCFVLARSEVQCRTWYPLSDCCSLPLTFGHPAICDTTHPSDDSVQRRLMALRDY